MKRVIFLVLLGLIFLTGCTSLRQHTGCDCKKCQSSDSSKAETESMRKTIDESAAGKERKKSNGNFLYGGLSSEAKEIEDHLYGN